MDDVAKLNALARQAAVESEISELSQRIEFLRSELARIRDFLRVWDEFAGIQIREAVDTGDTGDNSVVDKPTPRPRLKNPSKESVAEAAREIIHKNGAPMKRSELFHYLYERGVVIQGTDPEMVLSTMLWRMQKRVARTSRGYWLAEIPYPEAGYLPGSHNETENVLNMNSNEVPDQQTIAEVDEDPAMNKLLGITRDI